METKKCHKCGRELPLTEFNKKAAAVDGLQGNCKSCAKEYARLHALKRSSAATGSGGG